MKSRSRKHGQETQAPFFRKSHLKHVDEACEQFGCVPYIAFVIDRPEDLYMFLIPKDRLLNKYKVGKATINWSMTEKSINEYINDPDITVAKLSYDKL